VVVVGEAAVSGTESQGIRAQAGSKGAEEAGMTQQMQLGNVCPVTDEQCRFLSMEWSSRIFTRIKKDPSTGLFIPDKMGSRKVLLGPYCSNHPLKQSGFIIEMKSCPSIDGKDAPAVKIPVKRGRKPK